MTPPPRSSTPSQCTCFRLRRASRRVTQVYDHALAPVGLSLNQYSILRRSEREPRVLGELADELRRATNSDRYDFVAHHLRRDASRLLRPDPPVGRHRAALLEALLKAGQLACEPLVYEDFLPVSAAGIFQSNLGDANRERYRQGASRAEFERALGRAVQDELALYADYQSRSLQACASELGIDVA